MKYSLKYNHANQWKGCWKSWKKCALDTPDETTDDLLRDLWIGASVVSSSSSSSTVWRAMPHCNSIWSLIPVHNSSQFLWGACKSLWPCKDTPPPTIMGQLPKVFSKITVPEQRIFQHLGWTELNSQNKLSSLQNLSSKHCFKFRGFTRGSLIGNANMEIRLNPTFHARLQQILRTEI